MNGEIAKLKRSSGYSASSTVRVQGRLQSLMGFLLPFVLVVSPNVRAFVFAEPT